MRKGHYCRIHKKLLLITRYCGSYTGPFEDKHGQMKQLAYRIVLK